MSEYPYPKVTIKHMLEKMDKILKSGKVNDEATILWMDVVEEGSRYSLELGVPLGSILFGIEWFDDDEPRKATLRIDPEPTSYLLN